MRLLVASVAALVGLGASAAAAPVKIVAAENFYGDLARQIGGAHVEATSILTNPDQDPHLFEASPQTARAVADADIVIANGADYDDWMKKLLAASPSKMRRQIDVGALVGAKPGANPHLWYSPANMIAAAKALTRALIEVDPADAADYRSNVAKFEQSLKPIDEMLATMRVRFKGAAVAASEPVFGYAADAIGLDMREQKFALSVMNDTEPSPSDVATFENDLRGRKVRALLYNSQASEPAVERLVAIARESGVPVVGVTETEPPDVKYQVWVKGELDALDRALGVKVN